MSINRHHDMVPPAATSTVPLTGKQKLQLAVGCLPLILYCIAAPIYGYTAGLDMRDPLNLAWAGGCLLFFGFLARNWLRDLVSGVAVVREAKLTARFSSSGTACATFAQLGTLIINDKTVQATAGRRYRIVYSPATRLIWTLELTQPERSG